MSRSEFQSVPGIQKEGTAAEKVALQTLPKAKLRVNDVVFVFLFSLDVLLFISLQNFERAERPIELVRAIKR